MNSLFGSSFLFYKHVLKRFISGGILKRGKFISGSELRSIIESRRIIRRHSNRFYSVLVEANPKVVCRTQVYLNANAVLILLS